ncbi:MAG TPA: Smr/MutS family protein [Gammaproteobacteria bacterium]|nr:Smr/MutS family protein [Gammaproteobacteria bacterium]
MNDDDDSDFADLIPGVRRLRSDRINVYEHRAPGKPRAIARAHTADNAQVFAPVAGRDGEAWFNPGLQKKLQRRIRMGQIRPEDSLDLHGCRQQEALEMLASFLEDALGRGLRMVVIVHGRGLRSEREAVLRPLVQRWLGNQSKVLAWCPAQVRDGATGASYVYLQGG